MLIFLLKLYQNSYLVLSNSMIEIKHSIKAMESSFKIHFTGRVYRVPVNQMTEKSDSKLVVTTNTSSTMKTNSNESSIIFGVVNNLILMIANDIGVRTEFNINKSSSADIVVNFNDDANFISLWPFYQHSYCYVYSNSKKLTFYRSFITTMTLKDYLILAAPIAITMGYHFLVMRCRLKKTVFDSFWNAYLYALQTFTNGATPNLDKYPHDKFFLTGLYIFIFVAMFTFLTIFSSRCTVPKFLPAVDQELVGLRQIEYTKSFGIGEPCLREIMTGAFERRSCMLPCFRAKSVANITQQIKITNDINFRHLLKVSRNSTYFFQINRLLKMYNEIGVLEAIFKEIHRKSYSNLTSSTFNPVLTVEDVRVFILNGYVVGIWCSWLSIAIEMLVLFRRKYILPYYRRRSQQDQ